MAGSDGRKVQNGQIKRRKTAIHVLSSGQGEVLQVAAPVCELGLTALEAHIEWTQADKACETKGTSKPVSPSLQT